MVDNLSSVALRVLGTVDSLDALAALDTTILKNGALVFVTSVQDYFFVLKNSTAAADGTTIVASATGSPGRWFRMFVGAGVSWETQSAWFVDPISGSDNNTGLTALAPIATMSELQRRIGSTFINQPTVITILNDIPNDDQFIFNGKIGQGGFLDFRGTPTVQATATLTAVTAANPVTGVRGFVTDAGFDWTPYLGMRARVSAGTNVGCQGWLQSLNGGATSVFVSTPNVPVNFLGSSFTIGDTVVIEQLTRLGPIAINAASPFSDINIGTVIFRDLRLEQTGSSDIVEVLGVPSAWLGCDVSVNQLVTSDAFFSGCLNQGGSVVARNFASYSNGDFRTVQINGGEHDFFGMSNANRTNDLHVAGAGTYLLVATPSAFWDWTGGPCMSSTDNAYIRLSARVWGSSSMANTRAFIVERSRGMSFNPNGNNTPTVVGAGVLSDFSIDDVNVDYAVVVPGGFINPITGASVYPVA